MLRRDFAVGVHVVKIGPVFGDDHLKWSPAPRGWKVQHLGQEYRRRLAVVSRQDRVVEMDGHVASRSVASHPAVWTAFPYFIFRCNNSPQFSEGGSGITSAAHIFGLAGLISTACCSVCVIHTAGHKMHLPQSQSRFAFSWIAPVMGVSSQC